MKVIDATEDNDGGGHLIRLGSSGERNRRQVETIFSSFSLRREKNDTVDRKKPEESKGKIEN